MVLTFCCKYIKKNSNQKTKHMNQSQEIINLILKSMFYEDFKNSFTGKERAFIQDIRDSELKRVRISTDRNHQTILIWESGIGDTVGCYVGDNGFQLSSTVAYKRSTGRMKDGEDEKLSHEKQIIVDQEVEDIKSIFTKYFVDVAKYLK